MRLGRQRLRPASPRALVASLGPVWTTGAALTLARVGVLALAAGLRGWRLQQGGYGNEYYSAAVRSMMSGWHAFFYNSFDPAGFVSVDKPPVALWIQVASAKLLGFHGLGVLLPQALEGVGAVALLYHLVRRRFGEGAGLLAALLLALMPVSVAVDRSSNTDSCLVLVLLLAAWALTRAAEEGRRGLLLLSMALIGLGFNVKMLAAFVVLPTFALVYWLGASVPWRRRLVDLALAAVVLVAVSLPWALVYDLTPADRRPFAGSSRENSMLELAVGHNGIGRFVRRAAAPRLDAAGARATAAPPAVLVASPGEAARRSSWLELFVRTPVGALRLADGRLAGQVGWLFPLAAMGLVTGALLDRWRRPLAPAHLALILWGGWAVTYGVVYSYAGGIFHFYYLATMAPPVAALAAVGGVSLWGVYLRRGWHAALLPVALLLTAAWQLHVESSALGSTLDGSPGLMTVLVGGSEGLDGWRAGLHRALLGGTLAAALALLVLACRRAWSRPARMLAAGALAVGLAGLLLIPAAWALSSVLVAGNAVLPSANLSRLSTADGNADTRAQLAGAGAIDTTRLAGFLAANRQGERYLLATSSTRLAAPIIIGTGDAVMAMGGFHGLDPILTPETLGRMVEARQVRFVMLGDLSLVSRRMGGLAAGRPIADWVRANGALVDPALWRAAASATPADDRTRLRRDGGELEPTSTSGGVDGPAPPAARAARARVGGMQLYDLRPESGVVRAPSTP